MHTQNTKLTELSLVKQTLLIKRHTDLEKDRFVCI